MITVEVPLKVSANRTKTVIGPYKKIKDHYFLILSYKQTGSSIKWEPHILIDRAGYLEDKGIAKVSGPIVLLKYRGRKEIPDRLSNRGISVYIPPWGFPAILVFVAEKLKETEYTAINYFLGKRVIEILYLLIENIKIIEK